MGTQVGRTMRVLIAVSLITLALAGCTGSGGGDDTGTVPPQDDQGRYVIEVGGPHGQKFSPADATVPVGATVVWLNKGGLHNAVANEGEFDSGDPSSESWEFEHTFDTAGTFPYHCEPHVSVGMTGTITVE